MKILRALFPAIVLALAASCSDDRGPGHLPDLNALFDEYYTLDSLGQHLEIARILTEANRDLRASELHLITAWAYESAGEYDSVVAQLHKAIDLGMANPNILDKFAPLEPGPANPGLGRLLERLDSIAAALHSVDHFDLEVRSMESFWPYFEAALADTASARRVLKAFVLEGPPEIRDFYVVRYGSIDQMYGQMINGAPDYYRYLKARFDADSVLALKDQCKRWMERFRQLYPQAVFPKVYVVPGILNSGGTTTEMGLFVGGDMYGRSAEMPTEQLNEWQQSSIMTFGELPGLTLHELMHFQQNYSDPEHAETLLAGVIGEGVCDFLVELASGNELQNENLRYLEDPVQNRRIFEDLRTDMLGSDNSKWLYNGGSIDDRPHDLGYTVGYLITKSYYQRHSDKRQAVYELLNSDNLLSIVMESDYAYLLTGEAATAWQGL